MAVNTPVISRTNAVIRTGPRFGPVAGTPAPDSVAAAFTMAIRPLGARTFTRVDR